jgi:hypothetical protein
LFIKGFIGACFNSIIPLFPANSFQLLKRLAEVIAVSEESYNTLCFPNRDAKIAELAYYKAEIRRFEPGRELEDWLYTEPEFAF